MNDGLEEPGGECRSDELDDDVCGHATPREISSKREPHTHGGIKMCAPETLPMNRMIAITIRPGATTAAARLIVSGKV